MQEQILRQTDIQNLEKYLISEEKSAATREKYLRDAGAFLRFAARKSVTKELVIAYKNTLLERGYAVRSVNSVLASLNRLFSFLGWQECGVKHLKLQQETYCPEEKELSKAEYLRLVQAAKQNGNERLCLLLQTICGTGIRVSELQFITVEAAKRGEATVSLKGKTRTVLLVKPLQKKLLQYAKAQKITAAMRVYVTSSAILLQEGKAQSSLSVQADNLPRSDNIAPVG